MDMTCELEEACALADLTAKPTMMGASQVRGRGYSSGPHEARPQVGTSTPRGGALTIPPPHGQATLSGLHKGPPSGGQTHVEGKRESGRQTPEWGYCQRWWAAEYLSTLWE